MAMLVGFELGKCEEPGCDSENATVQIRGKNYCYKCGKKHINEAVEDNLVQAKKRHGNMNVCKRCGEEIPENGIHLFRNWPGRKEGVEKTFPNAKVSFCKNPPPPSFFEENIR